MSKTKNKSLRIGLVGCGVVGGGVAEALLSKDKPWNNVPDSPNLELVRVADINWPASAKLGNGIVVPKSLRTSSIDDIISDPTIDTVIELIGGTSIAQDVIIRAIKAGKNVVTANKALLAKHGKKLFLLAGRAKREIAFEAAVAGGIPILSAIRAGLSANKIETIYGILNGTTNFILTRMTETGCTFSSALLEAQRLGFAEADPTLDIQGYDAAHKIQLLTALALGINVDMKNIPVRGIQDVSDIDISYAKQLGCKIKLIASAKITRAGIEIEVAPTLISNAHQLASVNNEINAVFVEGNMVGQQIFVGKGAGRYPTASAVISDCLELASGGGRKYVDCMNNAKSMLTVPKEKYVSEFYLRISASDKPGVLGTVTGVLGKEGISIKSCVQLESNEVGAPVPIALMTHNTSLSKIEAVKKRIDELSVIKAKTVFFSVIK